MCPEVFGRYTVLRLVLLSFNRKEEEVFIISALLPLLGRIVCDRTAFRLVSEDARSAWIKIERVSSCMDLAEIWQAPGENGLYDAKPLLIYKISKPFSLA